MELTKIEQEYIKRAGHGDTAGVVAVSATWVVVLSIISVLLWREAAYSSARGLARLVEGVALWQQMWVNPAEPISWAQVTLIQHVSWCIFFTLIGILISFFKILDMRQNHVIRSLWEELQKK